MQDLQVGTDGCIRTNAPNEAPIMQEIDQDVWDTDNLVGQGLASSRFADVVGSEPTLLIFLRHLGWIFTREIVHEVVRASKAPGFPKLLLIHRASVEDAASFFASRLPAASAISDVDGVLFKAFGLTRGSLTQLLGPRAIWSGLVAMLKGNFVGKPTGQETQMPGAFLVRQRKVLWEHRARHAGDQPDLDAAMRALNS